MAEVYKLREVLVGDESAFAEIATTFEDKLPVRDATVTLVGEREADGSAQARLSEKFPGHPGGREATLVLRLRWIGCDGSGSITESYLQQLLGDGLGGNEVSGVGGTVAAGATTTSIPYDGGASPILGSIVMIGAAGDGKAEGECGVVGAVGSPAVLLNAMPGAPADNDLIRAAAVAYHSEGATLTTKRFCVMSKDTGAQIYLYGCQLAGARLTTPMSGGFGEWELTYRCAYWNRVARTFPDSIALSSANCAPIANGRCFSHSVGTTTRVQLAPGEIAVNLNLGLDPIPGPGGVHTYQWITGWTRTACDASIDITVPWTTDWETWWDTANSTLVYKHLLWQSNRAPGLCNGFYAPRLQPSGQRPSPVYQFNNQNFVRATLECREGATTTSELTRSSIRFFMV